MKSTLQEQAVGVIRQECSQAARPLLRVAEAGVKAVHHFHFNIGGMREYLSEDIRTSVEHRGDFERLAAVRHVLYLIFNEGYSSSVGPDLQRPDLSNEAIRLTRNVMRYGRTSPMSICLQSPTSRDRKRCGSGAASPRGS